MSYHLDPTDLTFDDLFDDEARELEQLAHNITIQGRPHLQHPAFLAWALAGGYDERQSLLVHTTAFPPRALLSTTRYWRERVEERQTLERDCEV